MKVVADIVLGADQAGKQTLASLVPRPIKNKHKTKDLGIWSIPQRSTGISLHANNWMNLLQLNGNVSIFIFI